jgi:hypothetical protein
VKTNVVTAVEIHSMASHDANHLPALVERTNANGFKAEEISADKA